MLDFSVNQIFVNNKEFQSYHLPYLAMFSKCLLKGPAAFPELVT